MTKAQEPDSTERLGRLLIGKTIKTVRVSERELAVEFEDGGRLFVDGLDDGKLELSVT